MPALFGHIDRHFKALGKESAFDPFKECHAVKMFEFLEYFSDYRLDRLRDDSASGCMSGARRR